jgi:hypothetical protein
MKQPRVIINTPFPTAAEIERDLGISPRESHRVAKLVADTLRQRTVPGFDRLVEMEQKLAEFSVRFRETVRRNGLTVREIARRMATSPAAVHRIVSGAGYNSTLDTLMRFAWACGFDLDVRLVKRNR